MAYISGKGERGRRRRRGYSAFECNSLGTRNSLVQLRLWRKSNPARGCAGKEPHQLHKSCYTGHEIVERVRSRGQVNRRRVGLRFTVKEFPPSGEVLTADGKEAGTSRAPHFSPMMSRAIGYGLTCEKKTMERGQELQWQGGTATSPQLFRWSNRMAA